MVEGISWKYRSRLPTIRVNRPPRSVAETMFPGILVSRSYYIPVTVEHPCLLPAVFQLVFQYVHQVSYGYPGLAHGIPVSDSDLVIL